MISNTYFMDSSETIGCGCPGCQSGTVDPIINFDASGSGGSGGLDAPSTAASPQQFANYLTHGFWQDTGRSERSWSQDNISFSISNSFTAAQKEGLRAAFDQWADVADISFTEVSSGANIAIAVGNDGRAYSSSFTSGTAITSNSISIDTSVSSWNNIGTLGNYAFMTALHEIGHSLGLGHTGNYNGSASYNNDAQWTNDSHQMTVMSYFNASNVGSDHWAGNGVWQYAASPMLIDIVAIQNIYGADYTTRSGNTVYGFNSTAGRDQFDFSISETPIAIWDGGGIDTIDLSGYSQNNILYLTEGDFSSVGNMTNNLVIAYGAEIENAIGGTGDDTIYGNDLNNNIAAGLGDDVIHGSAGNDTLNGGSGNDTINYNFSVNDFAYNFISNTVVALTHLIQNFTDTLSAIENFIFSDGSFTFSELEQSHGDLETIALRMFWNGGNYKYNSEVNGTEVFTATDMGYGGASGNQMTLTRNAYDTTVTLHSSNAPNVLRMYGTDYGDTITINGTHSGFIGQIYTGLGNDTVIISVSGNDRIDTGAGDDVVSSGDGFDRIFGGSGNDTISGGNQNDKIYGMDDNDILNGDGGNDLLVGGDGDDTLNGGADHDRLEAGNGNDFLVGGTGNDKLYGQNGADVLNGGDGQDYLYGGTEGDTLNGDGGNDFLYGHDGDDVLNGGAGHDLLSGNAGGDILSGEDGVDRLEGGIGNDTLNGGNHNDTLYGEDGNDLLNGDAGNDTLYGGNNNDTLVGGGGLDLMYGQAGSDTFGFTVVDINIDQILDFDVSSGSADRLNISDVLNGFNAAVDDINDFVTLNMKNADRTDLFMNSDGTGSDWQQIAIIRGSDFTGVGAQDLLDSGQLITDQSLL